MYTVVIADDETRICSGLELLVPWAEVGFEVVSTCASGGEVMQLLYKDAPDLLVTDIYMDGCSGIDLLRTVDENQWKTKVLLISGYQDVELAMSALRYNAMGYLLKPINMQELRRALERIRYQLDLERGIAAPVSPAVLSFVAQVQSYLRDHLSEDLSLDSVSARFHVSSAHLSRLFKQDSGENFIDYLTHCRIEKAQLLLRQPAIRISEVGDFVGYHSNQYFSEVFKKYTGVSPREYRQGNQLPDKGNENG